jgi:hypothetical protein
MRSLWGSRLAWLLGVVEAGTLRTTFLERLEDRLGRKEDMLKWGAGAKRMPCDGKDGMEKQMTIDLGVDCDFAPLRVITNSVNSNIV